MSTPIYHTIDVLVPTVGGTDQYLDVIVTAEPLALPVSACIEEAEYWPEAMHLFVKFTSGHIYEYLNVWPETIAAWGEADSPGAYFNQYVKGVYECEQCFS